MEEREDREYRRGMARKERISERGRGKERLVIVNVPTMRSIQECQK